MSTTSQSRVHSINIHLNLLPDPVSLRKLWTNTAELKAKANKNKIKNHMIGRMTGLIERLKKMAIAQKMIMERT